MSINILFSFYWFIFIIYLKSSIKFIIKTNTPENINIMSEMSESSDYDVKDIIKDMHSDDEKKVVVLEDF